jgi:hypothetical protein
MAAYPVGDSIGRTLASRRSWAGNGSGDAPTPPTGSLDDEPRTRRWVTEERARPREVDRAAAPRRAGLLLGFVHVACALICLDLLNRPQRRRQAVVCVQAGR